MVHNILYRRRMCLSSCGLRMIFIFIFQQPTQILTKKKIHIIVTYNSLWFWKMSSNARPCFNVQVVLHEAKTSVVGYWNKRWRRSGQQDIDKSQRFQDTSEHAGVLHCSVSWRSQKVCTVHSEACRRALWIKLFISFNFFFFR